MIKLSREREERERTSDELFSHIIQILNLWNKKFSANINFNFTLLLWKKISPTLISFERKSLKRLEIAQNEEKIKIVSFLEKISLLVVRV